MACSTFLVMPRIISSVTFANCISLPSTVMPIVCSSTNSGNAVAASSNQPVICKVKHITKSTLNKIGLQVEYYISFYVTYYEQ